MVIHQAVLDVTIKSLTDTILRCPQRHSRDMLLLIMVCSCFMLISSCDQFLGKCIMRLVSLILLTVLTFTAVYGDIDSQSKKLTDFAYKIEWAIKTIFCRLKLLMAGKV